MGLITSEDIQRRLREIGDYIGKKYTAEHPPKKRDWRTYEQQFALRIKTAVNELDPLSFHWREWQRGLPSALRSFLGLLKLDLSRFCAFFKLFKFACQRVRVGRDQVLHRFVLAQPAAFGHGIH